MSKGTFEFQTIESSSNEILYKDKGSKFFGYAFPIYNENDVKNTKYVTNESPCHRS